MNQIPFMAEIAPNTDTLRRLEQLMHANFNLDQEVSPFASPGGNAGDNNPANSANPFLRFDVRRCVAG